MKPEANGGFTLVELAVATAAVMTLAAISLAAFGGAFDARNRTACSSQMRQLALGVMAYAGDNAGRLPRSNHSAASGGERGWMREILPYLGQDRDVPNARFRELQAKLFRCPSDKKRTSGSSFGLNVFFELDPSFDDYEGAPQTWRTLPSIPRPSRTVLLAEVPASADHVMAHFWGPGGFGLDVAAERHRGTANYAFADGHMQALPLEGTFDAVVGLNLWNPGLAR